MKNIHVMLPPAFRDLWKGDFQAIKNEDVRSGRGWLYEADPFAAKEERDKLEAARKKKLEESSVEKDVPVGTAAVPGFPVHGSKRGAPDMWAKATKVEMGKSVRREVEGLLKKYIRWNVHGVVIPPTQRQDIIRDLSSIGFREAHVQEALGQCKDREEALEWLLVHVPEDDLPKWSLPENYSAGVSLVGGNVSKEAAVARLSQAGYSADLCRQTLEMHDEDESKAAETLQSMLCQDMLSSIALGSLTQAEDHDEEMWNQELETLESTFGHRYARMTAASCTIKLEVAGNQCLVRFQKSEDYPLDAPVLSFVGSNLPAYIKLSIYRQAIQYAYESCRGQPMVYLLVDWLETEIPRIVDDPGSLRDIAAAATTVVGSNPSLTEVTRKAKRHILPSTLWKSGSAKSLSILRQWNERQDTEAQRKMMAARQSLPAWKVRDKLLGTMQENQVTIVSGPTGSGKSTQAVQFILDDMIRNQVGEHANVICTQPRRISALGLADRVSEERCASVGKEIGYAIRGESRQTRGETRITFCTTGVLLRKLQMSGDEDNNMAASALAEVSHVVVDEVHERSLDSDFLLILLRELLPLSKQVKLILMSATLDAAEFESYFRPVCSVGKVEIEGRTFPVTDYHLDDVIRFTRFGNLVDDNATDEKDIGKVIQSVGMRVNYELLVATVTTVHQRLGLADGSILIFLPGVAEINRAIDALSRIHGIYPLPLHASLTPADQRRVFRSAPRNQRKVVAATNVAETSITIPDCVAVIDTGRVKETSFDTERGMIKLEEVWASQAACQQRRGRAGRVAAGECYKLYTRAAEAKMPLRPMPEITRVPLEQLCLAIRAMGRRDVADFLAKAPTPPETIAVAGALTLLNKIGALGVDGEELTALGRHLASIPADLRCGKLMIYGAFFGCLESCLTIASILTVRSPFVSPQAKRDESKAARASFSHGQGDLIADMKAYDQWNTNRTSSGAREMHAWCDQNFLSHHTLSEISTTRVQYLSSLQEAGFIPADYRISTNPHSPSAYDFLNANRSNLALLRALIAGAFNPQIARIAFPDRKYAASSTGAVELDPEARTIKYFTQDVGRVFIHPGSTAFDAQSYPGNSKFMSYFSRMATSKIFIRELTPFNAYSLLMFSGNVQLDTMGRGLVVDGWLKLRGWARIGALVGRLRALLDEVLEERMERPGELDQKGQEVLKVVQRLVEFDGYDR